MIPLFLGLTIANLAALLATVVLGYVAVSGNASIRGWHMLGGTLAAILCIAVHCIVLTYFIATAKWIQHAVTVKGLDEGYATPTRSFRAHAMPAALGAMAAVFVTAVLVTTVFAIAESAWQPFPHARGPLASGGKTRRGSQLHDR